MHKRFLNKTGEYSPVHQGFLENEQGLKDDGFFEALLAQTVEKLPDDLADFVDKWHQELADTYHLLLLLDEEVEHARYSGLLYLSGGLLLTGTIVDRLNARVIEDHQADPVTTVQRTAALTRICFDMSNSLRKLDMNPDEVTERALANLEDVIRTIPDEIDARVDHIAEVHFPLTTANQ